MAKSAIAKINKNRTILATAIVISILSALLLTSAIFTHDVVAKKAKPLKSVGNHRLLAIVKFQDPNGKSNNCWDEIYARATPKNNNHDVLNKQTVENAPETLTLEYL